ncbi:nuclear transport factor 2 family protein [Sphingomonas sp. MMSM20]|uniref:nuclear transport factor 2 family protein n=1 Tax=Sphingomonas lycopersici TaxID=2951807 RepID=UPI00223789F7|nr:nuclear transport factor 2 family protein [Sphingomonas lycopersici]MCW6529222.1 nuclear transport factor 2 family protein [Sphingomonas lycopersici]
MADMALEDRIALQDLIAAYSWALDTGDVEGLVACFTADARMVEEVFEDPDVWEGHDGIRALAAHYFNAPGFPGRQHHVTQVQYLPQDDGSVRLRAFAFVTECDGEPPYLLRFTGWYQDHAVKGADGRWRFRSRTVRLWDGEVLKNFPGRGEWTPRKRPESLRIRQQQPAN